MPEVSAHCSSVNRIESTTQYHRFRSAHDRGAVFQATARAAIAAAMMALAACGGGSGGSSQSAGQDGPDQPNAGPGTQDSGGNPFDTGQFGLGGEAIGLNGELKLQQKNGVSLTLTKSGPFSFEGGLADGEEYAVKIELEPEGQACEISNPIGVINGADVTNVGIECRDQVFNNKVSGSVSSAVAIVTDSDTNDPRAPAVSNDTFESAQALQSFATVQGYVTARAKNTAGSRFANSKDSADYFAMTLTKGQVLELSVIDFDATDRKFERSGDIDIYLFDARGEILLISVGLGASESVTVPESGDYVLLVEAASGASKYLLTLRSEDEAASTVSRRSNASVDFVPGELIVERKSFSAAASAATAGLAADYGDEGPQLLTLDLSSAALAADIDYGPAAATSMPSLQRSDIEMQADQELASLNQSSFTRLQTLRYMKAMQHLPGVVYAEPNYYVKPTVVPNDPLYSRQWHYPSISLPQAWDITTGLSPVEPVTVAVIDTGMYLNQEDLVGRLVDGFDFIRSAAQAGDGDGIDSDPSEVVDARTGFTSIFHGTHVAGIIGASANNGVGIAGVSWGARIMPIRALTARGENYDIVQGIRYASGLANNSGRLPSRRADIVNLSFGGPDYAQAVSDAIEVGTQAGVIFVGAAGNESNSNEFYPAAYPNVLAVSSVDALGRRAPYSSYGDYVDLAAPGGDLEKDDTGDARPDGVLSTSVELSGVGQYSSAYYYLHGTSMAAPHVSGVLALMKSLYPALDYPTVVNLLRAGKMTDKIQDREFGAGAAPGTTVSFGYGKLNALKSVQAAASLAGGSEPVPLPPALTASPSFVSLGQTNNGSFVLRNEGGGNLILSALFADKTWLTVTPASSGKLLGTYNLKVNRSGLSDGVHRSIVSITVFDQAAGTSYNIEVPVAIRVGSVSLTGVLTSVTVTLAEIPNDQDTIEELTVLKKQIGGNDTQSADFKFENVPNGAYTLSVSSDIDFDGKGCTLGEVCGAYPTLGDAQEIKISNNSFKDRDMVAKLRSNITADANTAPGAAGE